MRWILLQTKKAPRQFVVYKPRPRTSFAHIVQKLPAKINTFPLEKRLYLCPRAQGVNGVFQLSSPGKRFERRVSGLILTNTCRDTCTFSFIFHLAPR